MHQFVLRLKAAKYDKVVEERTVLSRRVEELEKTTRYLETKWRREAEALGRCEAAKKRETAALCADVKREARVLEQCQAARERETDALRKTVKCLVTDLDSASVARQKALDQHDAMRQEVERLQTDLCQQEALRRQEAEARQTLVREQETRGQEIARLRAIVEQQDSECRVRAAAYQDIQRRLDAFEKETRDYREASQVAEVRWKQERAMHDDAMRQREAIARGEIETLKGALNAQKAKHRQVVAERIEALRERDVLRQEVDRTRAVLQQRESVYQVEAERHRGVWCQHQTPAQSLDETTPVTERPCPDLRSGRCDTSTLQGRRRELTCHPSQRQGPVTPAVTESSDESQAPCEVVPSASRKKVLGASTSLTASVSGGIVVGTGSRVCKDAPRASAVGHQT